MGMGNSVELMFAFALFACGAIILCAAIFLVKNMEK